MARKSSGKPWLHGASGWWCATIGGKRKKLDKDYKVACRKLKSRLAQAKRGDASGREWLDASFSELADEYLGSEISETTCAPPDADHIAHRIQGTPLGQ